MGLRVVRSFWFHPLVVAFDLQDKISRLVFSFIFKIYLDLQLELPSSFLALSALFNSLNNSN